MCVNIFSRKTFLESSALRCFVVCLYATRSMAQTLLYVRFFFAFCFNYFDCTLFYAFNDLFSVLLSCKAYPTLPLFHAIAHSLTLQFISRQCELPTHLWRKERPFSFPWLLYLSSSSTDDSEEEWKQCFRMADFYFPPFSFCFPTDFIFTSPGASRTFSRSR